MAARTHRLYDVVLVLGKHSHALHHLAVRLRIAVLEGQLFQLLLDGVQTQQTRKWSKDLQI